MYVKVSIFLQILLLRNVLSDGTYECGDHGRFEYCIDEIPGCVIGCHCHPGYYFDTDTKICEPNSRLIEHHKRRNFIEPTPVQRIDVTPKIIHESEPPSSTSKIDSQVDEIAKDANDLGDWLYNQFFKTIENQVINNTNDKDILTRRAGSRHSIVKPKRKNKSHKEKSTKPRGKKEHLRRKLLRITENDSLFDISSKSESDSSHSSSSDSSAEYERNNYDRHDHDDDDEHGHKQIVMINKKPKPQLPSFIFLPNLDTPFYPPLGLPPPPIVPMYPMVPVPPVPLCPIPGCDDNDGKVSSASITTTTSTTTAAAATMTTMTTTMATTITETPSLPVTTSTAALTTDAIKTTNAPDPNVKSLRLKNRKKKKTSKLFDDVRIRPDQRVNSLKAIDRQKILQRLQENMNSPTAKLFIPSWKRNKKIFSNTFVNQNLDAETPFLDNGLTDDIYMNNEIQSKPMQRESVRPDNVDFKYITELIHRVDLNNKSNNLPPIEYNPLDSVEVYQPSVMNKNQFSEYNVPFGTQDGRRMNHPTFQNPDESYYANLGRQIATMIRGIDTQDKHNVGDKTNQKRNEPYFYNNSPTSFWERSVRSPLQVIEANNNKFEYLKRSNELLFDIENKVEIIASTAPALSLREIENIVNVMEAAKRKIRGKENNIRKSTSHNNLNIDLWPSKLHHSKNSFRDSLPSLINNKRQENNSNNLINNKNNIVNQINKSPGVHMHSVQKFIAWNGENDVSNIKFTNRSSNIQTAVKNLNKNKYFTLNRYLPGKVNTIQQIPAKTNAFSQNTIKQSFLNQHMNPLFLRHRKYFQDRNYPNEELAHLPTPTRFRGGQPSYFQHEINHYDYME